MTRAASAYVAHRGFSREPTRTPRQRFKLDWWGLLGPDGYWPIPYSLDEAFQAIAWAMERSWPAREEAYTPAGLLRGGGAVRVQPWPAFLTDGWPVSDPVGAARAGIRRMLLGGFYLSKAVIDWRESIGVIFDPKARALTCRPVIVTKPAYRHDEGPLSVSETGDRLARLLACEGRGRLLDQHNPCHAGANYPQSVRLSLQQRWEEGAYEVTRAREERTKRWSLGWRFELCYGYPPPEGSTWILPLAMQAPEETFVDVLVRAEAELARLTSEDPSRSRKEWATTERVLQMQARAARVWGAPEAAIREGVRFARDEGGYTLEAGGGVWRCRWDRVGGKHGSTFVQSDDASRAVESAQTWAPDWRVDAAAQTVRDWDGEVLPVKPGDRYAEPWRGPFGYPGWAGMPPGCSKVWRRWARMPDGHLQLVAEIHRMADGFRVCVGGVETPAADLAEAGRVANAQLGAAPGFVVLESEPDAGREGW